PAKERKRLAAAEKRVKELERELHRKEKALAETAALLVLEKKLHRQIWLEPQVLPL
ncbi:IS3 family transposase, partial [Myxococcus llanfairpwllgwyngyllgogerychwyrndrobwllllantysiliogogogochensis]